ncbi:MAG TPA: thermonuclease family protein [Acidimicrobiales bacterium]|nr:thermonuclease family protein [Acidimicrobiales bacterium]
MLRRAPTPRHGRSWLRRGLLPVGIALFAGAACNRAPAAVDPVLPPDVGVVTRVVDGDTLRLRLARRHETVRLIGIDTPESVRPRAPVECFGREAARRLRSLVPPGTQVRLERDVELRDRYDRLLAYVFRRRDGLFVNEALARDGFARTATIPPNQAYVDRFVDAVTDARAAERGLWHACRHDERGPP